MLKGKWKDGGATVDLSVYKLVRLRCYLVSSNPSRTMLPRTMLCFRQRKKVLDLSTMTIGSRALS